MNSLPQTTETITISTQPSAVESPITTISQDPNSAGTFQLKEGQKQIRDLMTGDDQKHVIFQAPMSYGKTATGLAVGFNQWYPGKVREGKVWLVVVPPNAVDTWQREATAMYGGQIYNSSSMDSPILIPSKSKHHKEMTEDTLSPQTHLILISMFVRSDISWLIPNSNFIVDESHKSHKKLKSWIKPEQKILMLSASDTDNMVEGIQFQKVIVPEDTFREQVPVPKFQILTVDENEVKLSKVGERDLNLSKYYTLTQSVLAKHTDRVVIFCPKTVINDFHASAQHYNPDRPVFKFVKSTTVISKFQGTQNGIMVLPHTASEAINIDCETAIIIRGDWVNKERVNQMVGRFLRTSNPNKEVPVYHILPHGMPRLRTLYTNACYLHEIHLDPDVSMAERLESSFRLMYLLDANLEKTTTADIVAMVNLENRPPQEMYDWWNTQDSEYPDELKRRVLFLPFFS